MPDPLNVVVDISHHNGNVNLAKAKEDGILGVIQKATQGQTFKDPTYQRNRQKAKDAGLLWGAYHFATGSDGLKQAQHFLDVVGARESQTVWRCSEQHSSRPVRSSSPYQRRGVPSTQFLCRCWSDSTSFGSAVSCLSSPLLPEGSRDRFPTFPVGAIS